MLFAPTPPPSAEVNGNTRFEKHMRNLRPGYDWVPTTTEADAGAAAATAAGDAQQQQQQQQEGAGHWERRVIEEDILRQCNMDPAAVEVRVCVWGGCLCAEPCV